MNFKKTAYDIVENVGGPENINSMTYCATRLRFNLKDQSKANTNAIENLDGVISVNNQAGQYQVIVGTQVNRVYEEANLLISGNTSALNESGSGEETSFIDNVFSTISAVFAPLLPALAGSGILRAFILLSTQIGILDEASSTYHILTIAAMTIFGFLPVILAYTSALRFKVSPVISMIIGASLINPDYVALMMDAGGAGETASFLGIPLVFMNYGGTVIPIILAIFVYSYLERFLDRIIPEGQKLVFLPMISLLVMIPLTMIAIGPIGAYGGIWIANIVTSLLEKSGLLAGMVVGGGWNVLVLLGVHWAVNPIMINNIATVGIDYIVPLTFATNFAMAGATFGVYLKSKDQKMKQFALSSVLTIGFAGITEPAIYGVAVKLKRPFIAAIIGGAVGGGIMGMMEVSSNAFVFGGLTTLPAFIGGNFTWAIIGLAIAFGLSALLAYIFGFEENKENMGQKVKK